MQNKKTGYLAQYLNGHHGEVIPAGTEVTVERSIHEGYAEVTDPTTGNAEIVPEGDLPFLLGGSQEEAAKLAELFPLVNSLGENLWGELRSNPQGLAARLRQLADELDPKD